MSNSIIRTVNDYIEKFRYTLERLTLASVEFAENATHSQPPTSRFAEPTGCRVVGCVAFDSCCLVCITISFQRTVPSFDRV